VCRAFGADIQELRVGAQDAGKNANPVGSDGKRLSRWIVRGVGAGAAGGKLAIPDDVVDVGNSGTTLFLALAIAALSDGATVFTGDAQIRRRSADKMLAALEGLGATAFSTRKGGCAPIVVRGPLRGGRVSLECPTSQYLSALLIAAPLAPAGVVTEIDVPLLNERPYVEMTLSYLDAQGVRYEAAADRSFFRIPGGASYAPMDGGVGGDFSSAAFPACAAAVSGGPVTLLGLDPEDTQGDKAVFEMLTRMGCRVEWSKADDGGHAVTISRTGALMGADLDLNATPDALPALAATACFASGETGLLNVANARIKETDRISVMARELRKLGASIEELSDGLIIMGPGVRSPALRGGKTNGHDDHRVVMALAVAALGAGGPVEIDTAESAAVTYPGFLDLLGAETVE
jgi:3-phosphoshikimate 1-carboxyvinyltransferase